MISAWLAERDKRKGFEKPFRMIMLSFDFPLKEMQKDMDEKMDVLINIQKGSKL